MQQKIDKKFFLFETISSELVTLNCLYKEENTCHRHSVCWEIVLRFSMSLTETFCKSIAFTVINKYGKSAALQILTMVGGVYHVAFQKIR